MGKIEHKFYIKNNGAPLTIPAVETLILDEAFDDWVGTSFPDDLPVGWSLVNTHGTTLDANNYINEDNPGKSYFAIKPIGAQTIELGISKAALTVGKKYRAVLNVTQINNPFGLLIKNGGTLLYQAVFTGDNEVIFTATSTDIRVTLLDTNASNPDTQKYGEAEYFKVYEIEQEAEPAPFETEKEIFPNYEDLSLNLEKPDLSHIKREVLNGGINVRNSSVDSVTDFDDLKIYLDNKYTYLDLRIEEKDRDTELFFTRWNTELLLTGEWDLDKTTTRLDIKNLDIYYNIFDDIETEIDWNALPKASVITQMTPYVEIIPSDKGIDRTGFYNPCWEDLDDTNFISTKPYGRVRVWGNAVGFNDDYSLQLEVDEKKIFSCADFTNTYADINTKIHKILVEDKDDPAYEGFTIIEENDTHAVVIDPLDEVLTPIDIYIPDGVFLHEFMEYIIGVYDSSIIVQKSFTANGKPYQFYADYPQFDTAILSKLLSLYWQSQYDDIDFTLKKLFTYLVQNFRIYWDIIVDEDTGDKYFTWIYYEQLFQIKGDNPDLTNYQGFDWSYNIQRFQLDSATKPYRIKRTNNYNLNDFNGQDILIPLVRDKSTITTINNSEWNNDLSEIKLELDGSKGNISLLSTVEEVKSIIIDPPNPSVYSQKIALAPKCVIWIEANITAITGGTPVIIASLSGFNNDGYEIIPSADFDVVPGIGNQTMAITIFVLGSIGTDKNILYTRVLNALSFNNCTGTITSVSINNEDSKHYRIKYAEGAISGNSIENGEFSQANIDANYATEMPEVIATINGVDVSVEKAPDKIQNDIEVPLSLNTNTINYRNFIPTNLGNCRVEVRERNLQDGMDKLTFTILD